MFFVLIWFSSLWRVSARSRPGAGHRLGFLASVEASSAKPAPAYNHAPTIPAHMDNTLRHFIPILHSNETFPAANNARDRKPESLRGGHGRKSEKLRRVSQAACSLDC